jgi:hypothetical protein
VLILATGAGAISGARSPEPSRPVQGNKQRPSPQRLQVSRRRSSTQAPRQAWSTEFSR